MATTALSLIKSACWGANIPAPTALVSATDTATLQLLELFYDTGDELRDTRAFPQLKKKHTIYLESQRTQYQLPPDFYSLLPGTEYDQNNHWMMPNLNDVEWNYRSQGYFVMSNVKGFRIFGPDSNPNSNQGQLFIHPTPGNGEHDLPISFEYISKSWLMPQNWVPSGTVVATDYVNVNGIIYNHSSGTTNGTVPMTMAYGVGRDGGVYWKFFTASAWSSGTVYSPGTYVTNGGNLYYCTVGGTSAGSGGPTGTTENVNITDNTVTWRYKPVGSWTAQTAYQTGDIILTGGRYYRCVTQNVFGNTSQISGTVTPTWTATTVSDGTITWTHKSDAYERLIADTDLCVFDDNLMKLGLRWRFMRARGLEYQDLRADFERLKSAVVGKFAVGKKLSLGGGIQVNSNIPEGSWTF